MIRPVYKFFSSNISKNAALYYSNKDFASSQRDSLAFRLVYDESIKSILHLMYTFSLPPTTTLFIGPNPDSFLKLKPSGPSLISIGN